MSEKVRWCGVIDSIFRLNSLWHAFRIQPSNVTTVKFTSTLDKESIACKPK